MWGANVAGFIGACLRFTFGSRACGRNKFVFKEQDTEVIKTEEIEKEILKVLNRSNTSLLVRSGRQVIALVERAMHRGWLQTQCFSTALQGISKQQP